MEIKNSSDSAVREKNEAAGNVGFELSCSRHFPSWLAEKRLSFAFSTYQTGKVFLVGTNSAEKAKLSVFERSFERPMGLWADEKSLLIGSLYQIVHLRNNLKDGEVSDGYDRLYVPRVCHITGDIDIHDVALDRVSGKPVFVNTLYGCLATTSDDYSFESIWRPSFISGLVPEDRCHLNGLAMKDGRPAYVTAVSTSNIVDGWREHRADGGVVIDIDSNEIVCSGLSMPHSPRWDGERLWVANSGKGEFGYVDMNTGRFEVVAFCPGYIRGVSIYGGYAFVGLSKPRHERTFKGLQIEERLAKEKIEARCGVCVIDLKTGAIPHWIRIEGFISELYDVVALPNVVRPSMIGFRNEQICRAVTFR